MGQADRRNGRYEISLAKLVWYHEYALAIDPAPTGVRLSYALADVMAGKRIHESFMDLDSINRELGQRAVTAGRARHRTSPPPPARTGTTARSVRHSIWR